MRSSYTSLALGPVGASLVLHCCLSIKCAVKGWFFIVPDYSLCFSQDDKPRASNRWIGKVNFVEIRTYWHLFRSFDRLWTFFILCLQVNNWPLKLVFPTIFLPFHLITSFLDLSLAFQAMIILAWNGSGLDSIFASDVFKKVLSVFITASILKFGQGVD